MLSFDPTTHRHLGPLREYLKPWWKTRPSDVIGLTLYGSRAKDYAEQYSDWDVIILTRSKKPDEDTIFRDLPRVYDEAPIHALCESIDFVKSEAEYGGSLMSAIAEQGVSLFGETIPFEEDTIKHPSVPHAETLFASTLDALIFYLNEANIRFREIRSHDNTATACSVNAAEYLVKSFMSVRGINYQRSHDVETLCDQIEEKLPNDPLVQELRKLDGFTAKGHQGPYRLLNLPIEPLTRTTERLRGVLVLLPHLAADIYADREPSSDTLNFISGKLTTLQEQTESLEDQTLQEQFRTALDKVLVFIK